MGAPADVHCYTPDEFERKRLTLPRVRDTVESGIEPDGPDQADRDHPLDRQPRVVSDLRRHPDLVHSVAQRVAELRERDHLHEAAVGRLVRSDELDVRRRLAERMQHARLGRDDRRPGGWASIPRAYASIPPVESMWTPSESMSPAATYSMTLVEHPHSGWIRKSAPGWAARTAAMSSGLMPACTWHSPSHTCIARPATSRRRRPGTCPGRTGSRRPRRARVDVLHDLDRVRRGAAVVGLRLDLGGGVDVHDHDRARMRRLPVTQLRSGDRVRQRATCVEVRDQHRLVGAQDRGRLGHEVHAAEHDHLGVGLGRLLRESERVADVVGYVLDLR